MTITRRNLLKSAIGVSVIAGLARTARADSSIVNGVQLGVQTYSFHEILNDGQNHSDLIIKDMLACGLYSCELFGAQVEPGIFVGKLPSPADCPAPTRGCSAGKGGTARNPWAWEFQRSTGDDLIKVREKQRRWRETAPLDYFLAIRKQFNAAGLDVFSFNPIVAPDWSDAELDRTFQMAKALGVKSVNVSTTFAMIKRIVPFAEKTGGIVAPHGHGVTWDPEEFSTRATFLRAFALSQAVGANLDIGHYSATGADPVAFIDEFHDRIINLHIKDRKRNSPGAREEDGATVPWEKVTRQLGKFCCCLKTKDIRFRRLSNTNMRERWIRLARSRKALSIASACSPRRRS